MSAGSVTCMIIWPLRAFNGTPLTSMFTVSSAIPLSRGRRTSVQLLRTFYDGAALVLDHVLKFRSEVFQEALHRPRRGIAQGANRMSFDAIRHIEEQP